jgi:hypothetical protein
MNKITVDEALRQKLQGLTQELQFLDEMGQVLGTFLPAVSPSQRLPGEPLMDEEELRRIEQSTEWFTTEQVLAHLKGLENQ